jgi:alpha-L-rhamnosidase
MWLPRVTATAILASIPFTFGLPSSPVDVVNLSVDGRFDSPLGFGNPRPTLAWQMTQSSDGNETVCPSDRQTAYEIQAAISITDLEAGHLIWQTGQVNSSAQNALFGHELSSRDRVAWRVRVWDALHQASDWSDPATWSAGLLEQVDWGQARWIEYPGRTEDQPMPLFVRQFEIPKPEHVAFAHLYISGIGLHHATVNGKDITDEVLAPGYSNLQLSSEYRTYDVTHALRKGSNALGVSLGNGVAYVRQSIRNPSVGRNAPYAWWQSQLKGNSSLLGDAKVGSTNVRLDNTTGYHVGGSINIDTGRGGDLLESRIITEISNTSISFTPGTLISHETGSIVTGSGNNIAASDPSANAAVTPRLIARLEITYHDGNTSVIVSNREWRTALGPLVTDAWYSGADYDARREIPGWDQGDCNLDSTHWIAAGIAPPPNLATKLVARAAERVIVRERFTPIGITSPVPGTYVFNFGQNFAGWAVLNLPQMPPGITIKVAPAEGLNQNGTINQASLGPGMRGTDLFHTYTTAGKEGGESWHPEFDYFGMQWVQVTGLPSEFNVTTDLITGLRIQADVPVAGTFESSNARLNRVHKMSRYSIASNIMSVFTDCPGREKQSYPADYTMPMGAIYRNFNIHAFMHTTMRSLVEGQSIANTSMFGNVALKTPVFDWGYTGRFGDEINWGNAIVLVPSLLHDLYGDTSAMGVYYSQMTDFVEYIQREKVQGNIVDAALADWVEDDLRTSGRITGTWGYFHTISAMARIANITGHMDDAVRYSRLADEIRETFNAAFFNNATGRYTNGGNNSTANATQAAQALALDAGLVPEERRQQVLDALVELTYAYPSADSNGPHLSGGTIGMGPIVRALSAGGRDDVLWEALQQNDQPSYGYFMQSTPANPGGYTTLGEEWDLAGSRNHMILAQIDEWFHATVVGIRPVALTTLSTAWEDRLVFQPTPVGDLTWAAGSYMLLSGEARSEWRISEDGVLSLEVTVPPNTEAEVRVPAIGKVEASGRAKFVGVGAKHTSYVVPSGKHSFSAVL